MSCTIGMLLLGVPSVFTVTNIVLLLLFTTAINAVAAYDSLKRMKTTAGRYFAWAMVMLPLWTLATALDYGAVPIELKVLFARFEYLFYNVSMVLFLLFTLSYGGYESWVRNRWLRAALYVIPISNVLLAWTNPWHHLLWSEFVPSTNNVLIYVHGPAFVWVVASSYAIILSMLFLLLMLARSASHITRNQAGLLVIGLLIAILGNSLYLLEIPGLEGIDWTSILFSAVGLFFLVALRSSRLLDLVPVARQTVVEQLVDGVLVLDTEHRIIDLNQAAMETFDLGNRSIGQSITEAFAKWPAIITFLKSDTPDPAHLEVVFWEGDDIREVFDLRMAFLENATSTVYGKLVSFRKITDRHQAEQKLQQRFREIEELHQQVKLLAERDSLTNAFTRRYLQEHFSNLSKQTQLGDHFSTVLLDVDDFKEINDHYGHIAGDEMLVKLVEILNAHTDSGDLVCRFGGDEFVVLMAKTGQADAARRMEAVRSEFAALKPNGRSGNATISVGICEYPTHSQGYEQLISLADKAMYHAKQSGGNQIALYEQAGD